MKTVNFEKVSLFAFFILVLLGGLFFLKGTVLAEECPLHTVGLSHDIYVPANKAEVIELQKILSHDIEVWPARYKITGVFDWGTTGSMYRFQKKYGLPLTGILDKATRDKLCEFWGKINEAKQHAEAEDPVSGTLSASSSSVKLGETVTFTITAKDKQGVDRAFLYYQGSWHSQNCTGLPSCAKTFSIKETEAGTYKYWGYVSGKKLDGTLEGFYTNPKSLIINVRDKGSMTATTALSSSSNLNITFPKVSKPTLFVYPDPDIIKSVIPKGYDYYPKIERFFVTSGTPYNYIAFGHSRQFRAAIVYPNGTYTTSLDDKSRFEFEIIPIGSKTDVDHYWMPPLSRCITGFDYQIKPSSKPKIVKWIYERITGHGITREAHEDISSPDLADAAAILWNVRPVMTSSLDKALRILPALPYFQLSNGGSWIGYHWPRFYFASGVGEKRSMMNNLHYSETIKDGEKVWILLEPKIIKDTSQRGHKEYRTMRGLCDLTTEEYKKLQQGFQTKYPALNITPKMQYAFKSEIKDKDIKVLPNPVDAHVDSTGLVDAPSTGSKTGEILISKDGRIRELPFYGFGPNGLEPKIKIVVKDKEKEASPKDISLVFFDPKYVIKRNFIRPQGFPATISPQVTLCGDENKARIALEVKGYDVVFVFDKNKISFDPMVSIPHLNFGGDKKDITTLTAFYLYDSNLRSSVKYTYFPECSKRRTLNKQCKDNKDCIIDEECLKSGNGLKYCKGVLSNPNLNRCQNDYVMVAPSRIYPEPSSRHVAYCCKKDSQHRKGGSGCDAGEWVYPREKCQKAVYGNL